MLMGLALPLPFPVRGASVHISLTFSSTCRASFWSKRAACVLVKV